MLGPDAESTRRLRLLHDSLRHALHVEGIAPLRSGPLQPHLTLLYGTHACRRPNPSSPSRGVVESATGVYVLHAFQKKTQRTPARDIAKGKARYQLIP